MGARVGGQSTILEVVIPTFSWETSIPANPMAEWATETQLAQTCSGLSITTGLALQHKSQIILWPYIHTWAGLLLERPQLLDS